MFWKHPQESLHMRVELDLALVRGSPSCACKRTGKLGLGLQNEEGHRLTELCQEDTLVIANKLYTSSCVLTTQEKTLQMDITRWSIPKSD